MSTYNGDRFLREQLDSLRSQEHVQVTLYVRDDGSTDGTPSLLSDYAGRWPAMQVEFGDNIGLVASFLYLLAKSDNRAHYVAFADQDDVWDATKLHAAVCTLATVPPGVPALYCGRQEYVDETLGRIAYSRVPKWLGYPHSLVQNVATGCTLVLNASAVQLLRHDLPQRCLMHDWWAYLVVSALGMVRYDERSFVKYRQHGANVVGSAHNRALDNMKRLSPFVRHFSNRNKLRVSGQTIEFLRIFGSRLGPNERRIAEGLLKAQASFWHRARLAVFRPYHRNTHLDDFVLACQFLVNRY